ncbi:MAG: Unknown protein [uncultured Sulfurovum sp.]|uniref:Uncharacterized protein n=1 Tax=uncultured Sulfurovum sp. TaxID=269237 RepID=A0A6S6T137_9BACT|nr:MAG: Unknown protein [uncultured Sulfurovum sp.]
MAIDKEKMENDFQIYLMSINDNLDDLEVVLKEHYGSEYQLDFTIESLDKIEDFLSKQLENYAIKIYPLGKLLENVSTYMGEIARRKLSGYWDLERDNKDFDFGYPMITDLDGLPKDFGWSPIQVVFNFKRKKKIGLLKRATKSIFRISI